MHNLSNLWNKLPDPVKRAVHTFWQAFVAALALGLTPVLDALALGHFNEAAVLSFALVTAAVASALSALKGYVISLLRDLK